MKSVSSMLVYLAALTLPTDSHANDRNAPRIDNPARAPSSRSIRLERHWVIGDDNEAQGEIFGKIGDLVVDDDGNVCVLDTQARDARLFSSQGRYLRPIGSRGEGPGEVSEPIGLVRMPGGIVGVYQAHPARVSRFRSSDGQFVGDLVFEPFAGTTIEYLLTVRCRGGAMMAAILDPRSGQGFLDYVTSLARFDSKGRFLVLYTNSVRHFDFSVVRDDPVLQWMIGPDGRVYVNREADYEIAVYSTNGTIERVIAREYAPRERSDSEVAAIGDYYRRVGHIGNAKVEIAKHHRDVAWFAVADDGRLWVLSSRGRVDAPTDTLGVFDIYDVRGKLVESVELQGKANPERDCYYLFGDRVFVVTHCRTIPGLGVRANATDDEPMTVICYRVPE